MKLPKQTIIDIFKNATNLPDAMIGLFKSVTPWDDIEEFNTHPIVSPDTWKFIYREGCDKFGQDFSLTWMNKGFSGRADVKNWVVKIPKGCYTLKPKPDHYPNLTNP